MRCSSCEALLDRYVEGGLPPAQTHRVRAHLRTCPACEELYRELRVVDGLLVTQQPAVLNADFTPALMARVHALPAPTPVRAVVLPLTAIYVAAAWVATAAIVAVLNRTAPHTLAATLQTATHTFAVLREVAGTLLPAPYAFSFVAGALALDAVLLFAVLYGYRALRPRLAEHLAVARRIP